MMCVYIYKKTVLNDKFTMHCVCKHATAREKLAGSPPGMKFLKFDTRRSPLRSLLAKTTDVRVRFLAHCAHTALLLASQSIA